MSKKIIYLLSLLMALSLVFASCKKNSVTDALGGQDGPKEETKDESAGTADGLYDTWDQIKDLTVIKNKAIMSVEGGDYIRNPVVVAMNGGKVAVFAEKRINSPGAENDIGVDGTTPTQIIYTFTQNAGDEWSQPKAINNETVTVPADQSRSAVVVFKVSDDTVVLVASGGAGISRTSEEYSSRNPKSRIDYIIGKINGSGNDFEWGQWQKIDNIETKLSELKLNNTTHGEYKQFGTHSARGYVTESKELILPVIVAIQGYYSKENTTREMMGAVFFNASAASINSTSDKLTWDTTGAKVLFAEGNSGFSVYKEARTTGGTKDAPEYFVVPSPGGGRKSVMGQGTADKANAGKLQDTSIPGAEGSAAYLALAKGWYGTAEYVPADYATTGNQSGNAVKLFMHITSKEKNSQLRLLDDNYATKGSAMNITPDSKSASLDILPDGTIITAAEKERIGSGTPLKCNIFFTKYTQKYIAESTGNNQ